MRQWGVQARCQGASEGADRQVESGRLHVVRVVLFGGGIDSTVDPDRKSRMSARVRFALVVA